MSHLITAIVVKVTGALVIDKVRVQLISTLNQAAERLTNVLICPSSHTHTQPSTQKISPSDIPQQTCQPKPGLRVSPLVIGAIAGLSLATVIHLSAKSIKARHE
jgi:hypothetical protein